MAHGGGERDGVGRAVADRVGLFTTLLALGGFVGAIWVAVKRPRIAFMAAIIALAFTGITPDPTQHPLLAIFALMVGASLWKGQK